MWQPLLALVDFFASFDELLLPFFFFVSRAAKMFPLTTLGCPLEIGRAACSGGA